MDPWKAIGEPQVKIPELSHPVGAVALQSWLYTEPLSLACSRQKQTESCPTWKSPLSTGQQEIAGAPGRSVGGRSLQLSGEPEFGSGNVPLSSLPLTLPSLSPSALERKRSVGCSGQAPKQATDLRLPPRLEFPDGRILHLP